MCYEFEQYWVQRAEEARREAQRREEQRAKQESKPKQPVAPDGVKDPEPVPV
jgi:hypothetical protein